MEARPEQTQLPNVFDAIRHEDEHGGEYWSARELMQALTYTNWRNFNTTVLAAMTACEASGIAVSDHFDAGVKMIALGKGAERKVDDWRLSRYACYLIVQNGDSSKPVIALGQTYFAVQTRRMELADQLSGLSETDMRLLTRGQLAAQNTTLADAAKDAGVTTSRDFAVFQDHGYRGLYAGESARDIAQRKGLKPNQRILDYMGSEELAANLFRATQTEARLRREQVRRVGDGKPPMGRDAANGEHHEMGRLVRQFIEDRGGTPPERLPTPSESIAKLRAAQREQERLAAERRGTLPGGEAVEQASLFGTVDAGEPGAEPGTWDVSRGT